MILIITGSSTLGSVVVVFLIYWGYRRLMVYREKRREKKTEVNMMVVTTQEGGLIYQNEEGATGVEKLAHPGPTKVVTIQKGILILSAEVLGAIDVEKLDPLVPTLL